MNEPFPPPRVLADDDTRPLSYADVRRFSLLVLAVVLGAFIAQQIVAVLLLFVTVFLLAMVLNPFVSWLENRGVRRGLAAMLVVLSLLFILGLVVALVVPPIFEEINALAQRAPTYFKNIQTRFDRFLESYPSLEKQIPDPAEINKQLSQFGTRALGAVPILLSSTASLLGGLFALVVSILLLVFILANPRPLVTGFLGAVPERHREAAYRSLARIMKQMTAWGRATIINGLITGVSTGALLHFIGVQPALVFGVLAFFGEFVPNLGPIVASVPALFVALGIGPEKAGLTLAAILFVQQVESNVLVPFIMGRELELHPVVIVFFALAMGALFGVIGAILAVPFAVVISVLLDEFFTRPRRASLDGVPALADAIVSGRAAIEKDDAEKLVRNEAPQNDSAPNDAKEARRPDTKRG